VLFRKVHSVRSLHVGQAAFQLIRPIALAQSRQPSRAEGIGLAENARGVDYHVGLGVALGAGLVAHKQAKILVAAFLLLEELALERFRLGDR